MSYCLTAGPCWHAASVTGKNGNNAESVWSGTFDSPHSSRWRDRGQTRLHARSRICSIFAVKGVFWQQCCRQPLFNSTHKDDFSNYQSMNIVPSPWLTSLRYVCVTPHLVCRSGIGSEMHKNGSKVLLCLRQWGQVRDDLGRNTAVCQWFVHQWFPLSHSSLYNYIMTSITGESRFNSELRLNTWLTDTESAVVLCPIISFFKVEIDWFMQLNALWWLNVYSMWTVVMLSTWNGPSGPRRSGKAVLRFTPTPPKNT